MSESAGQASANLAAWLAGARRGVAITGASGWLGASMAHVALEALDAAGVDPAGGLRLLGSRTRTVRIAGHEVEVEPLSGAPPLGEGEWLVLHFAVIGADRIPEPEALRVANEDLLRDALALAGDAETRRFVHASSGSVDWPPHPSPAWQAYADLKRAQEAAALAWAGTSGVPLLFARIFNMGGPYMTQAQNYALGSFIQQALAGGTIRIGARRPVVRSYAHGLEFARVVFELALDKGAPLAFDTAGTEAVELSGLAAAVGRALDLPGLKVERPPLESEAEDRYVGDGTVYRAALARAGLEPIGLDQIVRDTAAWLKR